MLILGQIVSDEKIEHLSFCKAVNAKASMISRHFLFSLGQELFAAIALAFASQNLKVLRNHSLP